MFRKCICCLSLVVFTGLANEMGTLSADEPAADEPKIEIVKERFPNGAIAVELNRQRADGNNREDERHGQDRQAEIDSPLHLLIRETRDQRAKTVL